MSFFNSFRDNHTNQLDIRDIADNLENVIKSGDKFRATCPICGSKSARPFILFENGGYYCHSCTGKGGVVSLIKDVLRLDFSNFRDIFKNFNPFYKKDNVVNIKRRKVGDIKWMGLKGGSGKFSPHRLTGKKFVYIASGIAEFLSLNASELDYIVMQSDGIDINHLILHGATAVILEDSDKRDIKNQEDERYQCFKNPNQFNPFKKKVTEKIRGDKIAIDFEKILNREVKAGYDLRDFVTEHTQNWLELIEKEIRLEQERLERAIIKKIEMEIAPAKKFKREIVIPYSTRYPNFSDIKGITSGVVISRQHTGKTHMFDGVAGNLIIVPRVRQCNIFKGDDTNLLLDKIFYDGAIITFHKFYGHYTTNEEFREFIDNKKIKLIIDEAHELLFNPIKEFQLIYGLDALFLSATLENFFRRDLQRYRYKPAKPDTIYFTKNGKLPKNYRSLVFIDNAKALKANYPHNSLVGKQHDFEPLEINIKVEKSSSKEDIEYYFSHTFKDEEKWIIPKKKRRAFNKWLEHYKSGFIDRLVKLDNFKNLNEIYLKSNVAKTVKAQYNRMYKYKGERYNIEKFYKLLRSLVPIEMIDDKTGKEIKRVGSKTDLKNISIRVVGRCAIKGIKIIKEVIEKVVKEAKRWLDSFIDSKKLSKSYNIGVLKGL